MIVMATVPISVMIPIVVIIVAVPVFMRAVVSATMFFDGASGCHQQTGQAE
jgi:hypothetical protein